MDLARMARRLFNQPYSVSRLDRAALAQRQGVLRREAALVASITSAYAGVLDASAIRLEEIGAAVAGAQASGITPSLWWLYEQARLRETLSVIEQRIRELSGPAASIIERERAGAVTISQSDALDLLRRADDWPLGYRFLSVDPSALDAALAQLYQGSPLTQLLERIGPDSVTQARGLMARSIQEGWGGRKLGKELSTSISSLTRARATLIARDAVNRSYREAARQTTMVNSGVILGVRWLAAKNIRTCAACLAMDGRLFPADYRIASHPACRCRLVPVTESSFEPMTNSDEYLSKLSRAQLASQIGPKGAALYRAGYVTSRDFARIRRSAEWGDSAQVQTVQRLIQIAQSRAAAAGIPFDPKDLELGRSLVPLPASADRAAWRAPSEILLA